PLALPPAAAADAGGFFLQPGDRVCFYGDSITEQRYYGMDVETFVRTRFPGLAVEFVNAGVGGDRVGGGWAGGIDRRLERDVFPFKPTVVTIMLGMNDASYRAFDERIFATYQRGYEHLLDSLQQHLPGVRIVLLLPTPFDDITQPPQYPGGYNGVLLRYADFVKQLAADRHLTVADFMTPLLDVTRKAEAEDPKLAGEVLPGRVHPSAVGELVMAQALLQAWGAPATVTAVALDAAAGRATQAENTTVTDLAATAGGLAWTQADAALPFPILGLHEKWWQFPPTERDWGSLSFFTPAPQPDWDATEPGAALMVRLAGFYAALDQEPLKVAGLKPGRYALKINGAAVGEFTADQLAAGINLAEYHTPMLDQAWQVLDLVWKQTAWRFFAWRGIQTQLAFDQDPAVQSAAQSLLAALEVQRQTIAQQEYAAAKPQPARYELTPVGP
ncbi:MAG TPA: SGNH/GDSL hydrolase family protein, partial [Opitutaceae bacterium]|nr:SGNH/GDSL hydrolase family protein [Opitutaceae bacterium]